MNALRMVTIYVLGLLFGTGLLLSGLTRPGVVLGGLDFGADWNPNMWVVVVVATAIYLPARLMILRRSTPLLAERFPGAPPSGIDARLLVGAALFGIGWGICGSCPGQSTTALFGNPRTLVFFASLLGGMSLYRAWNAVRLSRRPATAARLCGE